MVQRNMKQINIPIYKNVQKLTGINNKITRPLAINIV